MIFEIIFSEVNKGKKYRTNMRRKTSEFTEGGYETVEDFIQRGCKKIFGANTFVEFNRKNPGYGQIFKTYKRRDADSVNSSITKEVSIAVEAKD